MLHPYFRARWFGVVHASSTTQKEAIEKAETLFRHVAETYFDANNDSKFPNDQDSVIESTTPSEKKNIGDEWFDECVMFDIPETPQIARNSKEVFQEEVQRYLGYSGGCGQHDANPLIWWKVRTFFSFLLLSINSPIFFRLTKAPFPLYHGWQETSWPFLLPVARLSKPSRNHGTYVLIYGAR